MPKEQIVASLDIGSSKIRTVIALLEEEKKMANIIGVGVSPSTGMRKGNIIDVDDDHTFLLKTNWHQNGEFS